MYNHLSVAECMSNLPPTICLFKSNAPVIHVDFSAESCPYHTRQWRISYRKFHEVHEHKGNILINFIFYISLIQIATESSVTAHFGMLNLMLGIHLSLNTCNLKIVSLVDWWIRPTHLKNKNESNARNLWWNVANLAQVYAVHPSVPQRYLKCKATPVGWGERPRKSHKKHQNFHVWIILYMVHSPKIHLACWTQKVTLSSWGQTIFGDVWLVPQASFRVFPASLAT